MTQGLCGVAAQRAGPRGKATERTRLSERPGEDALRINIQ
jgi:hypothetical protein